LPLLGAVLSFLKPKKGLGASFLIFWLKMLPGAHGGDAPEDPPEDPLTVGDLRRFIFSILGLGAGDTRVLPGTESGSEPRSGVSPRTQALKAFSMWGPLEFNHFWTRADWHRAVPCSAEQAGEHRMIDDLQDDCRVKSRARILGCIRGSWSNPTRIRAWGFGSRLARIRL
jgi:hypothetical protein